MSIAIKMSKAEITYLDNLARQYKRKSFLDCNSTQQQDRLELFEIEDSTKENGWLCLLHTELERNHGIPCGLDGRNNFVAYSVSCNQINRIVKQIFEKVRRSKKRSMSSREFKNFNKALQIA